MPPQVSVSINFLKRLELYKMEKPFRMYVGQPSGYPDARITNVETAPKEGIPVTDVRGGEGLYDLESHGFKFIEHGQSFSSFGDVQAVEQQYLPEVEDIIRDNVPGAERVIAFDWRVGSPSQTPPFSTYLPR